MGGMAMRVPMRIFVTQGSGANAHGVESEATRLAVRPAGSPGRVDRVS